MEIEKMNIYKKLLEVRKKIEYIQKQSGGGVKYKFVSSSQVLLSVRNLLDEYGLLLISENDSTDFESKTVELNEKTQIINYTKIRMLYTWVNVDNTDEKLSIKFEGHGMDYAGEKGIGKAYTYAEKYFLLKQFNIPTDSLDPDVIANQKNESGSNKEINNLKNKVNTLNDVIVGYGNKEISNKELKHLCAAASSEIIEDKKCKEILEFVMNQLVTKKILKTNSKRDIPNNKFKFVLDTVKHKIKLAEDSFNKSSKGTIDKPIENKTKTNKK